MITSDQFHRIKYHPIRKQTPGKSIDTLIGFDSETDTTGRPFLFGFGDGRHCGNENDTLLCFLEKFYIGTDFAVWNLKFDSGSVIYNMPAGEKFEKEKPIMVDGEKCYQDKNGDIFFWDYTAYAWKPGKIELWEKNYTTWTYIDIRGKEKKIRVEYIPHKLLKLSWGKGKEIKFWDICQFFQSGLDKAAKKYLGEGKDDIETKSFTAGYISKNLKKIIKYCIKDADLTGRLGNYFLDKLDEFGIRATSLYSSASISFRYFQDQGEIIGIKRFWKNYPDLVKMAIDSYEGGKFEVTARGAFNGYEYDIVSAYPYEMANLVDISFAKVKINTKYEKSAVYGFIRCLIECYDDLYLPCGIMIQNTRVYAIGKYYITVTKNEYDYLLTLGVKIKILSAAWLFVDNPDYPYRATVEKLFSLKAEYKKKDAMIYQLVKICLNGFYGKMAQCIHDWTDHYNAGVAFNPLYASIITANCRIRVSKIQNEYKNDCLAVHTDSVILTRPLQWSELPFGVLGAWEQVTPGAVPGVLVACGCYQIGGEGAFKGFEPHSETDGETGIKTFETWYDILEKYRRLKNIPYEALRVESWVEAVSKGHFNTINLFQKMPKKIDLNADIKRVWIKDDMTAGDYLKKLHRSRPRVIVNTEKPKHWKIP